MKLFTPSSCAWTGAITLWAFLGTAIGADTRVDTATRQIQRTDLRKELQRPSAEVIPSLYRGEEADVGPQYIVKEQPRKQLFEAFVDWQFMGTSNAYMAQKNPQGSTLMVSTAQVALAPPPWEAGGGSVAFKTGYRHQRFNYGYFNGTERVLNNNDFDSSTFFASGRYAFSEKHAATLGVDYTRLLGSATGGYNEFYSEVVPTVGVDGQYKLNEKTALVVSGNAAWRVSRVALVVPPNRADLNDRFDEVLMASIIREVTPRISFQPFYRMQFTEYVRSNGRKDFIHSVGAAANYALNNWASLRLYLGFEARESNDSTVSKYRKTDGGFGLSFQARF